MTDEQKQLTDEEATGLLAAKLVFFADALPGGDDAKRAFVEAVSQMSLEEAADLCMKLEDAYAENQTRGLDEALAAKLKEIEQDFQKAQLDLADQTLKSLEDLDTEIDAMNQPK